MAKDIKTMLLFEVEERTPVVHLPTNDYRRPKRCHNNINKSLPESTTEYGSTGLTTLRATHLQSATPVEGKRNIIVNLPRMSNVNGVQKLCSSHTSTSSDFTNQDRPAKKLNTAYDKPHSIKQRHQKTIRSVRTDSSNAHILQEAAKDRLSAQEDAWESDSTASPRSHLGTNVSLASQDCIDTEDSLRQSLLTCQRRGSEDHCNLAMQEAKARFQQTQSSEEQARSNHTRQAKSPLTSKSPSHASSRPRGSNPIDTFEIARPMMRNPPRLASVESGRGLQYHRQAMSQRTVSTYHGSQSNNRNRSSGLVTRRQGEWPYWVEVRVKVFGLTSNITTADLWHSFSKEGSITTIEIFEDTAGNRTGKACIRFRYDTILTAEQKYFSLTFLIEVRHLLQRFGRQIPFPCGQKVQAMYTSGLSLNQLPAPFCLQVL